RSSLPRQAGRDTAARRSRPAGYLLEVAEKGGEDRQGGTFRRGRSGVWEWPRLLRCWRHLARIDAAAHVANRISVARDARLSNLRQGGAGVLASRSSSRCRYAVAH